MSLYLKAWVISKQAGKLEIHYQPESCEIESNLVYTTLRVTLFCTENFDVRTKQVK